MTDDSNERLGLKMNIEKELFDIPEKVEFPMELCDHLRTKLHTAIEHNCILKRHVSYLDKEVLNLRKDKLQLQQRLEDINDGPTVEISSPVQTDSLMVSKIAELSKKNRDLVVQMESFRTKYNKVCKENDTLRCQAEKTVEDANRVLNETAGSSNSIDEDNVSSASQMSQITNKMIQYRRQCQQLKLELRTALRALSQEVGESATPQTVLGIVSFPSWRGRQQQIFSLHQKIAEFQANAKSPKRTESLLGVTDSMCGLNGEGDGYIEPKSATFSSSSISCNRQAIVQLGVNRHEQIRKLNSEIQELTKDLKIKQQDLKASKCRVQTLETQLRSVRNHVEVMESKLEEKDSEAKNTWDEMKCMKQELIALRDRENRNSEKTAMEIQELNRALARERSIVGKLQEVVTEKQEALQKADRGIIELKNKLELCCSNNQVVGGFNAVEKLQQTETELNHLRIQITSSEKEQKRLILLIDKAASDMERERQKVVKAQKEYAQALVVLQESDKCIDDLLDVANTTDPSILKSVENIKTMLRELKTGELYCLSSDALKGPMSTKKLRTKIELLTKEMAILQRNLQNVTEAHKSDMANYARVYEIVKGELSGLNR